jgi:hypothetical protein
LEVVERLLDMGALRGQRTAGNERAVDIARRLGNARLIHLLEPVNRFVVPELPDVQSQFHALIRERARTFLPTDQLDLLSNRDLLRFPDLEPTLDERLGGPIWFPVPGMYGGVAYRFDMIDGRPVLSVQSWSRLVGGSGQVHIVTPHGFVLVEDGFV